MPKTNGDERAFPIPGKELVAVALGLTKLEYAAVAAMQGLIAAGRTESEAIAEEAWVIAEAMFSNEIEDSD